MTGSGKSHTISGSEHNPGIVPRAVNHIFESLMQMSSQSPDQISMVCLSYVELYNNNLNDLLTDGAINNDSSSLKIHEHPKQGIYLSGSPGIRTPVASAQEALELIEKGNRIRAINSTHLNDKSSRSHTVITLEIITRNISESSSTSINEDDATLRIGKINLVDLAGSERVKLSGASGQVLEEAKQINKALMVLGDVLNALGKYHQEMSSNASSDIVTQPLPFVPYRNSKLTMLLKDSLGGNSKTMMLTTIRCSHAFYSQSLTALKYAARAKHIKNIPTKNLGYDNTDTDGNSANFMKKTLQEVARLKEQLNNRNLEFMHLQKKIT